MAARHAFWFAWVLAILGCEGRVAEGDPQGDDPPAEEPTDESCVADFVEADGGGRSHHSLVFDSACGRTLLVAGVDLDGLHGDVSTLESGTWQQLAAEGSLPPRILHGAAFDQARKKLVVFGGFVSESPPTPAGDTYEWDGQGWIALDLAVAPAARGGMAIAYDAAREEIVMYGGTLGGGVQLGDTWTLDADGWHEHTPALTPGARGYAKATFDVVRSRVVLFGGALASAGEPELVGDVWEWDGASWTKRDVVGTQPPLRGHFSLAYDEARAELLLFGGADDLGFRGDLWALRDGAWVERIGTGPSPRYTTAMAYDAGRQRVVLSGGSNDTAGLLGDVWEWDGAEWQVLVPRL